MSTTTEPRIPAEYRTSPFVRRRMAAFRSGELRRPFAVLDYDRIGVAFDADQRDGGNQRSQGLLTAALAEQVGPGAHAVALVQHTDGGAHEDLMIIEACCCADHETELKEGRTS